MTLKCKITNPRESHGNLCENKTETEAAIGSHDKTYQTFITKWIILVSTRLGFLPHRLITAYYCEIKDANMRGQTVKRSLWTVSAVIFVCPLVCCCSQTILCNTNSLAGNVCIGRIEPRAPCLVPLRRLHHMMEAQIANSFMVFF